jgi:transposase
LEELHHFQALEDQELIDLYYFDASSFSLTSNVPYAWQKGQGEVSCQKSKSIHVLGFMKRSTDFMPYVFEGSIISETVVACFDHFARYISKPTVVVIDNAPVQRSHLFNAKLEEWEAQGLQVYRLPSYSPELNLIEILWKQLKYYWLPLSAYTNYECLYQTLIELLPKIGDELSITFA